MLPEKTKLVLGRGEIYFDRFLGTSRDGERYFGNTPAFRIERQVKRLERMTSYRGQKQQRKGAVISETVSCTMTTDHMATENVALWHGADGASEVVGDALVPFSETLTVKRDRFYQIGLGENGFGIGHIDSAQVRMTNISGAVLTPGIHYTLERVTGRIHIPTTSPLSDGATIFVRYFKRPSASTAMTPTGSDVFGALRYVSRNPYGPQVDYFFPQVRLTPRGAVDMKGDEFRQVSFDIEAIRLAPNLPLVYLIVDKTEPLPITADTALLRADTTLYRADNGAWEV